MTAMSAPDEMDEAFPEGIGGPGPEDWANGAAALVAALAREANGLAGVAAGLRATLDLAEPDGGSRVAFDRHAIRDAAAHAGALAGALVVAGRGLARSGPRGIAAAAGEVAREVRRSGILPADLAAHLRAATLAPLTDDGAARIAAGAIAEEFARALDAAWRRHS